MQKKKVWVIPLAERGYFERHPIYNPVLWYLEDYETQRVIDTLGTSTKGACECRALRHGFELIVTGS